MIPVMIECVPNFSEGRDPHTVVAHCACHRTRERRCWCWASSRTPTTIVV